MNPEDLDRELGRLFEAQRVADEAAAPDLRALLVRPSTPRRASGSVGHVLAMVAAVAIVIVAGAQLLRTVAAAPRDLAGVTTLAEWRSPTDFLLHTPGSDIWTRVPSLGSTGPAADTRPDLSPTKGVER